MNTKVKKKIGLLFGSFNPIHIGHMILANYMLEFTDLSQVWFITSPHNPLKEKKSLLADHHRLAMVNIAIEDNYQFRSSSIEFKLPQPSYTIDTLSHLYEKHPDNDFILIMGSDNLSSLKKWKNYKELLKLYKMYVYPRPGSDGGEFKNSPNVKMVNAPLMEISSSFIRKAIKDKKNIQYMFPPGVY
ncbi:MAG: nicotinate-nucleotide adenylyltransferase, partial [Bacteroidales bacterium]|nr:nicotinate-nucleotide adenylyltransferase [Bacteroidales bacterium]